MFPGSQWNYPGLSELRANQLPTVHESLVSLHHQSKRYCFDSRDPQRMLSDGGTSHLNSSFLAESASVKKTAKNRYTCPICGKGFAKKWFFTDHVNAHNRIKAHTCPKCSKRFTFSSDVTRHLRNGVCTKRSSSA